MLLNSDGCICTQCTQKVGAYDSMASQCVLKCALLTVFAYGWDLPIPLVCGGREDVLDWISSSPFLRVKDQSQRHHRCPPACPVLYRQLWNIQLGLLMIESSQSLLSSVSNVFSVGRLPRFLFASNQQRSAVKQRLLARTMHVTKTSQFPVLYFFRGRCKGLE